MMRMKQTMLALATTGMLAGPALAAEGLYAEVPGVLALQPVQAVAVDEQVAEFVAELPAPPALAEVATQAAAGTLPAELPELPAVLALTPPQPFSAADMQALFVPGHEPLRVAVLSPQEMEETKGAWGPVGAVIGGFGGGFGSFANQRISGNRWSNAQFFSAIAVGAARGAVAGPVGVVWGFNAAVAGGTALGVAQRRGW